MVSVPRFLLGGMCVLGLTTATAGQPLPALAPIDAWGPGGGVSSVAREGQTLYVGGSFAYVGPSTGSFAAFDTATAALAVSNPRLFASLEGLLPLPDGGWIVRGPITHPGLPTRRLARLEASGAVRTAWSVDANGDVRAIATDGERLFIAGSFTAVNGDVRRGLAAVDLGTGATLSWNPVLSEHGSGPAIHELLIHGGAVIVGGDFDVSQGQPAAGLTALDLRTGARLPLAAPALGAVHRMSIDGGMLFLTGPPSGGGIPTGARIALATGEASAWNLPDSLALVDQLAASAEGVFVRTPHAVVLVDRISGAPIGAPVVDGPNVRAMALGVGVLYVATETIAGPATNVMQAYDLSTRVPRPQSVRFDNRVAAIAVVGDRVAAVGEFRSGGGVARSNVYALDLRTGRPTTFAPAIEGDVHAVALVGGVLIVGGRLTTGFDPAPPLAAILIATGQPVPWTPIPSGVVRALATDGRTLLVGGAFQTVEGAAHPNLVAFDLTTARPTSWQPLPDGEVFALAIESGFVIAGGEFATIGAGARGRGAAMALGTSSLLPWNPDADRRITRLAIAGGKIAVAGLLTSAGGQSAPGYAVFDGPTGQRLPFVAPPPLVSRVEALAGFGTQFIAGGNGLGAFSSATLQNLGWSPPIAQGQFVGLATFLHRFPDLVVVGGVFTMAGDRPALSLAIFPNVGPPAPAALRARVTGSTIALGWAAPAGTTPQSYVLDAMLGATNLGAIPIAGTSVAASVGPGVYTIRVRAVVDGVTGQASAPFVLTVPAPAAAPPAPSALAVATGPGVVQFTWTAGSAGAGLGNIESYVIEAGSMPGGANLAVLDTGLIDTVFSVGAPPGTYYVRVRARNASGQSSASNEVVVVVP